MAKRLTGDLDLTVSGQVLGSPNFMAPEQAQGRHREVGPPSDVYSMGALLYHLLTGRPPFQATTLTEVLRQVVTIEPAAPRLLNPSLPHDLETICLKCLEKEVPRQNAQAEFRQRYAADMHLAQLALERNNRPLAVSLPT